MCWFVGIYYAECRHVRFQLHLFCTTLYNELQRINDLERRGQYSLPFDPYTPGCEPYCLFTEDGFPDINATPGESGNVLWWVIHLFERCAGCEGEEGWEL
jgi:hypothetical protein